MRTALPFLILALILTLLPPGGSSASTSAIQLGSDVLFSQFHEVIEGKKVGLLTNSTGINSNGVSTIDMIRRDRTVTLAALFTPETGLDGRGNGQEPNSMYTHPVYGIPVYQLSSLSPQVTARMLEGVDLLLVDVQDTGSRHDGSLNSLYALMTASRQFGKPVVVLDRPNPLGAGEVDGPTAEAPFESRAGWAGLPLAHGMTIGELARFFNREIGSDLTVIPMAGYTRSMTFADTGLVWTPPSPSFSGMAAVLGYLATGLAPGTSLQHAEDFSWVGAAGINSAQFADSLNGSLLPGVVFFPEERNGAGGVALKIIDPRIFQPAKTGLYVLASAARLSNGQILPATPEHQAAFDQAMGSGLIREWLAEGKSAQELEQALAPWLESFLWSRKPFLIYDEKEPYAPSQPLASKRGKTRANRQADDAGAAKADSEAPPSTPTEAAALATAPSPPKVTPSAPVPPASKAEAAANPAEQAKVTAVPPAANPNQPDAAQHAQAKAEKIAYLTFDDGPSPITLQILDTLKAHDVKATFFVVGRNVAGNEQILKRILAEGHTLGGHSYSHDYALLYRNSAAFFADLEKGKEMIEQATGVAPKVFRYPGGSTNTVSRKYQDPALYNREHSVMDAIKEEARQKGYVFIDWNVTNGDGSTSKYTAEEALSRIKQQVKEQKEIVVLMHDSAPKKPTAESLAAVIQFLREKGYRFAAIQPDIPTVATVK